MQVAFLSVIEVCILLMRSKSPLAVLCRLVSQNVRMVDNLMFIRLIGQTFVTNIVLQTCNSMQTFELNSYKIELSWK